MKEGNFIDYVKLHVSSGKGGSGSSHLHREKYIEKKFNGKKVVTFVRKFEKFYPAENYHQDYYQESFINYLMYKKACGREIQLKRIWQ